MKLRISLFSLCFLLMLSLGTAQQKKRLAHDDYASWNTLSGQQVSPDGQWLIYEINRI